MSTTSRLRGPLECAAAMTILGASVPVSRLVLGYPMLTGQAVRYALATLVFLVVLRVRPAAVRPRPGLRDWLRLAALAVSGLVLFNVLMLTALRHADPAIVGTVVGGTPLLLALLGPLLRQQRPSVRLLLAAGVVIGGGALVHGGGRADTTGLLAAGGTMLGEVLFSLLALPLLPRFGALRVSAYTCGLAVPMLAVAAVVAGEHPRPPTAVEAQAYLYLGALLTVVAFLLWYAGLGRLGPERAGLFVGLLPVVTLATTALFDGRLPNPAQTAGVLVVAAGLATGLAQSARVEPDASAPDASARRALSTYSRTA